MTQNELKLQMVAKTNVGQVREHNEDNFIVTSDVEAAWVVPAESYDNPTNGSIMVVADGMGGMNAGEIASKITIDSICTFFKEGIARHLTVAERLIAAIQYAHQHILEYAQLNPETEGMGTTVVIAYIINDKIHVAWSGDSRCYLFRGGKLSQLTKDHSYVQTLLDEGKITKEQAFYHPQSNVIIQSLGDSERPPVPDVVVETLYQGDTVLLCSDGLNAMLEDHAIEGFLQNHQEDLTRCTDKLIEAANEAGGNDNITVVVNQVVAGNLYTDPPNQKPRPKSGVVLLTTGVLLALAGATFYPWIIEEWEKRQGKSKDSTTTATAPLPQMRTPPNTGASSNGKKPPKPLGKDSSDATPETPLKDTLTLIPKVDTANAGRDAK